MPKIRPQTQGPAKQGPSIANGNDETTESIVAPTNALKVDETKTKNDTISPDNETNGNNVETTDITNEQAVDPAMPDSGTNNNPKKAKCQCKCTKSCCKSCCRKLCPFFPRCCQLPLHNCLQLLAVADLFVTFVNIGIWVYFHQYDPFTYNKQNVANYSDSLVSSTPAPATVISGGSAVYDIAEFHETTTTIYGNKWIGISDGGISGVRFSKIGFVYRKYQQEVENMCGRKYYDEFLLGHNLAITAGVFADLMLLTYVSECMYQFINISILVTTCCFFDYTSGRLFLIITWNLELLPVIAKIYIMTESRSRRLCILQYGLGPKFRGLDALLYLHFLPMFVFRAYKLLVFTYFVNSMLELGNLEHQTRIEGITLHEYVERHDEYLRMNKNRDKSSSEDDEIDNV